MKRPSSPSSSDETDTKPYIDELSDSTSPSPPKARKIKSKLTPTKAKSTSEPGSNSKVKVKFDPAGESMVWDADGREALMDYLIAQGIKGIDKAVLAEKVSLLLGIGRKTDGEFGVTKQKIHNELSLGRNGNMRSKATKAARD
jgi:hypothetical protein